MSDAILITMHSCLGAKLSVSALMAVLLGDDDGGYLFSGYSRYSMTFGCSRCLYIPVLSLSDVSDKDFCPITLELERCQSALRAKRGAIFPKGYRRGYHKS